MLSVACHTCYGQLGTQNRSPIFLLQLFVSLLMYVPSDSRHLLQFVSPSSGDVKDGKKKAKSHKKIGAGVHRRSSANRHHFF